MTTLTADPKWSVFPCRPQAKAPWSRYAPHGHNSSRPAYQWRGIPDEANWGINCALSGLVVIDIDAGPIPEDLPATYTVKTGRGWHLYYLANPGETYRGTLRDGIDIKHNGYVIAAGSIHPDGHRYEVVDDRAPVALPDDLRRQIANDGSPTDERTGGSTTRRHGKYREFLQAAWADATARPAVRQDAAVAGVHHPSMAGQPQTGKVSRAIVTTMQIIQNPEYDENLSLLLVRAKDGKKLHSGVFAHGKVDSLSLGCSRELKDPIAVVGFKDAAYMEDRDYVNLNYSLDALCALCFNYAKYAQKNAERPGTLTI